MPDGAVNTWHTDKKTTERKGSMAENTSGVTEQQEQASTTPANTKETTAQAAQVDIAKIEQIVADKASKTAEKIMHDMLEKQGLDSEAIGKMISEWKSKQTTPEQTIQQLKNEISDRDKKITAYEQEKILRGHGLTDEEDITVYGIRINQLTADGKPFEQAAKEYFAAHPRPAKIPPTAIFGGTGQTPMTGNKSIKDMSYEELCALPKGFSQQKG